MSMKDNHVSLNVMIPYALRQFIRTEAFLLSEKGTLVSDATIARELLELGKKAYQEKKERVG